MSATACIHTYLTHVHNISREKGEGGIPEQVEERASSAAAGGPAAWSTNPAATKEAWTANATLSALFLKDGLAALMTASTDLSSTIFPGDVFRVDWLSGSIDWSLGGKDKRGGGCLCL